MAYKFFPDNLVKLGWQSTKKQAWNTVAQKSGSGKIRTMCNQTLPTWTIETKFNMLTDADYRQLLGFVASVKGGFEPFLWFDPEDNFVDEVVLPVGEDGLYQAVLKMGEWTEPVEYITDLIVNGQSVADDNIDGGKIHYSNGLNTIRASYKYYWLVRFADDGLSVERIFYDINKSKSFKLEVVRP